jgi:DNA repair exonuclease SbcCD nuclease subunit
MTNIACQIIKAQYSLHITNIPYQINKASLCLIISDVHCGKVISENQVMGLNKFNNNILVNRMKKLLDSFLEIIVIQSDKANIDGIYLFAIGDLIQGYLRNTDWVNCEFTPMEQVSSMTEILITFIDLILKHTNLPINLTLQAGNHGRMSSMAKMPSTDRVALCYETLIGESLKLAYRTEPRVEIIIPQGYDHITNIHGIKVLSHHGDKAKVGNKALSKGIAGIAPALVNYYTNLQQFLEFDLSILGHYHCASNLSNKIIVNGSVCGTDPFAFSLGYHELPTQIAFMIDSRYGVTTTWNLVLD